MNNIYRIRQVITLQNEIAVLSNAVFSAQRTTCMLQVPMAHENRGCRNSHCFHRQCLLQQLLSSITVVCIVTRPGSDKKLCTHSTGSSRELPRRLSIFKKEIFVLGLCLRAPPGLQQPFVSLEKTTRQYTVPLQVQNFEKAAKPNVNTGLSPCRPRSTPASLQVLHHQLSRQNVPSSSSVAVVSVLPIVFHVDDGFHSARSSSARSSALLWDSERMSSRNAPDDCRGWLSW